MHLWIKLGVVIFHGECNSCSKEYWTFQVEIKLFAEKVIVDVRSKSWCVEKRIE